MNEEQRDPCPEPPKSEDYQRGWNEALIACMGELFNHQQDVTQSLLERIGKLVKE